MKTNKIIYWVSTALVCFIMAASATMYFVKNADIQATFTTLQFPTFIIIPLAIAKYLGIIAILTRKSRMLMEWAYAGFFFDGLIAFGAHTNIGDSDWAGAVVVMVLTLVSRFFVDKVFD